MVERGYVPLKPADCRLETLKRTKKYLVWYHHLHTAKDILAKQDAKVD